MAALLKPVAITMILYAAAMHVDILC